MAYNRGKRDSRKKEFDSIKKKQFKREQSRKKLEHSEKRKDFRNESKEKRKNIKAGYKDRKNHAKAKNEEHNIKESNKTKRTGFRAAAAASAFANGNSDNNSSISYLTGSTPATSTDWGNVDPGSSGSGFDKFGSQQTQKPKTGQGKIS